MYICIEGNIGVGKTTLAMALAKRLKAFYLAERFEENTLLPLFYNDPDTFAFPTEYSFLIDRQKQLASYFASKARQKVTVGDFHFDKSICFAKANLSKKDFLFYKKHFKAMQQTVPSPDLIVYLHTTPDLLLKNIQKRGRIIEKGLKPEYLTGLEKSLDNYYLIRQKASSLVLPISISEYTPETPAACCDTVIKAVKKIQV